MVSSLPHCCNSIIRKVSYNHINSSIMDLLPSVLVFIAICKRYLVNKQFSFRCPYSTRKSSRFNAASNDPLLCSAECGISLWRASVGWRPGSAGSSSVAPASVSCHLSFNCDTFPKISNQEPSDSGSVTFRFHVQQENDNRQPRT